MEKTYRFVGVGQGIPGLPHEVTDEQAKALGLADILKSAVANGNYAEVAPVRGSQREPRTTEGE